MKRAHEALDEPGTVALRKLEQVENILSDLDGMEEHRERVTDVRSDLGHELIQKAYCETVEEADEGDFILFDEAASSIERRSGGFLPDDYDEREERLNAMERNIEWLHDHDPDENTTEAAKRLGLIKGDVQALIWSLDDNQ